MCITIENSPRIMAAVIVKWIILICVLSAFESVVEGTAGTFDYIVDCSACQAGNFSMIAFVYFSHFPISTFALMLSQTEPTETKY